MSKFELNAYIYDDKSLSDFRKRILHIHSVIHPDRPEVWPSDFRYNEESDTINYWVEHWEDKFTCDYCERFAIPSSFVSNNLSDEEIKRQWLKLHPEETEEVAINGIPKLVDIVYVIHKIAYEAQCNSHEDIEVFSTLDKARARLKELKGHFIDGVIREETEDTFSGGRGDWSYYYFINKHDVL